MPVTVRNDTALVRRRLAELEKFQVLIGVPAEKDTPRADGISNAVVGYLNEYGEPEKNIPQRPHLVPGVTAVRGRAMKLLADAARAAVLGRMDVAEAELHKAGLLAVNSVRGKITDRLTPPLSPRTLAARRARGRTGDKPLFDTGQYVKAVTYVVRRRQHGDSHNG